ncbi:Fpg/Nei family DNA glycosylase [Iamia sp. SCSIO 61187]|uniref:Fpg/Nei family DNA glycosylase n=1 Tax=Iamia sp. SCSIO 61187 TaxID=2722752 RepID=UPI001C63ACA0|nr:DNA-formamidopyrimidine glycosylase family protein [Iamia sp. SCSIO 61187]QYG93652.1 Fpg/Nei family DNA glycosylase [Iamia sp. SCSIO 61187]
MPEGHTIHGQARDQRRDLAGHALRTDVVQDRFAGTAARLDGQVLVDVEAYGKHLFQDWEDGSVVHVHLGLYGKWRRQPTPPEPMVGAVRLRLVGPTHAWDLAGATVCTVITPEEQERIVGRLGPDPLRDDADPERFLAKVARSATPIGALLLDQAAVAGIGNVYRAEVLFTGGIDPRRPAKTLRPHERDRLWAEIVHQLHLGLEVGHIVSVRDEELDAPRADVERQDGVYVYHRDTCRVCGTPIRTTELAARRIDWCPSCQPRRPRRDHEPPVGPPPGAPPAGEDLTG